MSGAGNLFTVIDNSIYRITKDQAAKLAPILCNVNNYNSRKTEGLILIDKSTNKSIDFAVDFYNPDGTNDAMCGNGGRCAVAYALQSPSIPDFRSKSFTMASSKYNFDIDDDLICLYFPEPKSYSRNITLSLENTSVQGEFVDVGSKHFVVNFSEIDTLSNTDFRRFNIDEIALPIRHHTEFAPNGVNVNIYQILDNNLVNLRTFERGVEFETGACGTGAISTAFSIVQNDLLNFPICIIPPSGEQLIVDIITGTDPTAFALKGPAKILEIAEININPSLFNFEITQ